MGVFFFLKIMKRRMTDNEFRNITTYIFDVFFKDSKKTKINKINVFLEKNKLINIRYLNLNHLIGIQYYTYIIQEKSNSDLFFKFLYKCKTNKITLTTIIKKINTQWNQLKNLKTFQVFKNKQNLLSCLESKLICFFTFIKKFLEQPSKQKVLQYEIKNKKIECFYVFNVEIKSIYLIGCKRISTNGYQYKTYVPMSCQIKSINELKDKNIQTLNVIKVTMN